MGILTIYHTNAIETATLSGGSWDATLSLEKLRDPRPKLKAQSADAQLTSTQFRMALITPKTLLGIQLISTNFSQAAQYRISWYSDSDFTTLVDTTGWVAVGDSIDWTDTGEWPDWESEEFWLGSEAFIDPDNLGRDVRIRFAAAITAQYIKVEIDDTSNSAGFVRIGHAYVGTAFVPSMNFAPDSNKIARVSNTSMRRTPNGSRWYARRGAGQAITVAWPHLPSEEVLGEIDDIVLIHDIEKPVYVDMDPEDTDATGAKKAFLATIEQLPDYVLTAAFFDSDIAASVGFQFQRVL